jgi:hypothetical protein
MVLRSRPYALENLRYLLDDVAECVSYPGFEVKFTCDGRMGVMNDCTKAPTYARPSYNLHIKVAGEHLMTAQYELDKRFSLELAQKELSRIENLLAYEIIFLIMINGVSPIIQAGAAGKVTIATIKESEDKKFLNLN